MSEESKELELVEKRLDVLERTLFGNGHKGLKAELVELKTQIETFKRIAVWQIGILENACLKRVIQTTQSTYNVGEVMERAEDGILHVTVGPQTASVYIAAKNVEEN